jgi:hypothetical protein
MGFQDSLFTFYSVVYILTWEMLFQENDAEKFTVFLLHAL